MHQMARCIIRNRMPVLNLANSGDGLESHDDADTHSGSKMEKQQPAQCGEPSANRQLQCLKWQRLQILCRASLLPEGFA